MDYTKMTEARLTEIESLEFWDQFERGVLAREKQPTPREAAEFVRELYRRIEGCKGLVRVIKCGELITNQSYAEFIDAVEALARKYRPRS